MKSRYMISIPKLEPSAGHGDATDPELEHIYLVCIFGLSNHEVSRGASDLVRTSIMAPC